MSIHPGYSGQAFLPESLDRIRDLRAALPEGVHVQVDGGVTAENVADVREAGADLIVAGSARLRGRRSRRGVPRARRAVP